MTERRDYHVYEETIGSLFDPAKRRERAEMDAITGAIMNRQFANWLRDSGVLPTDDADTR